MRRPSGVNGPSRGRRGRMRAVFFAYLAVIITGLVYFTVIGLTHH